MDYDNVRSVLGNLTRGQEHVFTTPELRIEVKFTKEGEFNIFRTTRSGSSSIESFTSLKDAVNNVMLSYYPCAGQVYQHINSNIYTVIGVANEHSLRPDYPPTVVYQGENGLLWAKPLTNFQRKMTRIK